MAIDAIEAYVADGPHDPVAAVQRLEGLQDAYAKLMLDSVIATEIAEAIERRKSIINGDAPSASPAADHLPHAAP